MPVVAADRSRPDLGLAGLVTDVRLLDRSPGLQIDALGPVDARRLLGGDQLAGLAVEHVEEAVGRRVQQHLARLAVER